MIKLIGSMAVFLAGSGWGIIKCRELSKRVENLARIENVLLFVQGEIGLTGRLLSDVFAGCEHPLFKRAALYINERGAADGFKKAVWEEDLPDEERKVLLRFAGGLIAQDKEGQMKNIKLCSERLTQIKAEAGERKKRLGKLYAASGVLGSAAVVLILI